MGSRRVLGNDPFQRGAAERAPTPAPMPPSPAGDVDAGKPVPSRKPPSKKGSARRSPKPPRVPGAAGVVPKPSPSSARRPAAPGGPAPRTPAAPRPMPSRAPTAPEAPRSIPPPPVPLAASVVPQPLADVGRGPPAGAAPPARSPVPALTWTPLPEAAPSTQARQVSPQLEPEKGVEARDAGAGPGALLETLLRQAPGVLAEAWSAIEAALRAIRAGLGTAGGEQLDVYGRDARLSDTVAPLVDFLYHRWFRVEVEGAAHVPAGGALLVANHAGALPL